MVRRARESGVGDVGSVTVFVVGLVLSFTVAAGMALDGGRLVTARVAIADHAENAARVGAQQIGSLRSGRRVLSASAAKAAAMRYLAMQGLSGEIVVDERSVTVTTRMTQPTTILQLVGITARTVSVSRRAEITSS